MTSTEALQIAVRDFTRLADEAGSDETRIAEQGRIILAKLISSDDWLPDALAIPHPQYYQQYLLHCDPQERFSIVSFVWGPGQKTPIHDHTVWGLIGMLRGAERSERFLLGTPGSAMRRLGEDKLEPGAVDYVSPTVGDIHQVSNAYDDKVSISIHVYGANIGKVRRHVYEFETSEAKDFCSGYANPG
jgi:predicted metal-dependent enzyme (double-stranded beta helix superfamily)